MEQKKNKKSLRLQQQGCTDIKIKRSMASDDTVTGWLCEPPWAEGGLRVAFPVHQARIESLNSPVSKMKKTVAWIHLLQYREKSGLNWLEAKVRKLLRKLFSDSAWWSACFRNSQYYSDIKEVSVS